MAHRKRQTRFEFPTLYRNLVARTETQKSGRDTIRPEECKDYGAVENLVRESFWNIYRPGCSEHYVIHVLRDDPAFVKELDSVMEQDGRLIGQNMFMKTVIEADDGSCVLVLTISWEMSHRRRRFSSL